MTENCRGIIFKIEELLDENRVRSYIVAIEFEDMPNLKLGKCEVKQGG